jgi:site-specific recombinase XerD
MASRVKSRCINEVEHDVQAYRHTFGAHKADKHMGIATLQELMGHKKKETTLKYIHLAKTNLRQEMVNTAL